MASHKALVLPSMRHFAKKLPKQTQPFIEELVSYGINNKKHILPMYTDQLDNLSLQESLDVIKKSSRDQLFAVTSKSIMSLNL